MEEKGLALGMLEANVPVKEICEMLEVQKVTIYSLKKKSLALPNVLNCSNGYVL